MSAGKIHSCIDCAVTRCDAHHSQRPYPAFCPSQALEKDRREAALAQYQNDPEDQKLAQAAAGVEADGYRKWPRVQETIVFAQRMGYHKIGIATCVGLIRESRTLAKILRAHGFAVYGVGCKVGELPKNDLGIPPEHHGPGDIACNPILQAELLNEAGTELNIVMGLCVGHDSLFYKHAKGITTTLVTKDRVTGHNPAAVLYNAESYYSDLQTP
ncbi:MAG: DUF1847 domain-containing protein [Ruminiclostridium sp.]|jgi:uncharacterized metal-binding protein|nr:DUF1847 domain-containing protein [Ruminiclostridium sp.]